MTVATPELRFADVVVVGSGVAGLSVALRLKERPELEDLDVVVLSKSGFGDGSSRWAQGGIACALDAEDSPQLHARDTLKVSGELGAAEIVEALTREAPERIADLIARGARFDRQDDGELGLGREGGHSRSRILHAGGDATGAEVMRALCVDARERPGLEVVERMRALDLIVSEGRVVGLFAADQDGRLIAYRSRAVVLATGGFGAAFLKSTNPPEATGDAIAIAARAGATLVDMEFVQFHPTALDVGAEPMPLLTEALRGAGAILVDGAGRRFMPSISPQAELAPRDLVARAIWERLTAGEQVFLDARPALAERAFPTAVASCLRHGLDLTAEPVPVSPAAHYTMGGVEVDGSGRSSLAGLWLCGEAAGSGVHGANRLASNSLLEGLVFGARVADDVGVAIASGGNRPTATFVVESSRPALDLGQGAQVEREVRSLLWERVGLVRTAHGLQTALRELRRLAVSTRAGDRARDLVTLGLLTATAALARSESRGAHFRRDHPTTGAGWQRRLRLVTDPSGLAPRLLPARSPRRSAGVS